MKSEIKSAIILGIIVAIGIGILGIVFATFDEQSIPKKSETGTNSMGIDKSGFKKAPELLGIAHYLNTTPEKLNQEIESKVVLYDIWTYSCINCIRTIPYITSWHDKYSEQGLLIIGIH